MRRLFRPVTGIIAQRDGECHGKTAIDGRAAGADRGGADRPGDVFYYIKENHGLSPWFQKDHAYE